MKKLFPISLLIFFVSYLLILPLLVFIQKIHIHQKNWEYIEKCTPENSLHKEINIKAFEKFTLNNKKEILINNHLYDIVSYTITNDRVLLTLTEDHQEEELLVKLKTLIKLFRSIDMPVYMPMFNTDNNTGISDIHRFYSHFKHFVFYSVSITSVVLQKISPPPKISY